MHPDGDELVFLVSGAVDVVLDRDTGAETHPVGPGQAFIVPRGVWHRVVVREPSELLHVTPGLNREHRAPVT